MTVMTPPTEATNGELVRWAFERVNEQDVSALKGFWTAESLVRFPDRTCRGTLEIASYFEDAFAAVPQWKMELVAQVEQGENVFVRWHLTGTHDGPLLGIEPTGKPLAIDGMDHFVIRDGKLVSNFVVYDQMQYARQIGMMPPDGSLPDRAMKSAFNARTKLSERLRRQRSPR